MNWIQLQGVWINFRNVVTIECLDINGHVNVSCLDGIRFAFRYKPSDYLATKSYLRERLSETTKKLA